MQREAWRERKEKGRMFCIKEKYGLYCKNINCIGKQQNADKLHTQK